VPDLLDRLDGNGEGLSQSGLGKARGDADPRPPVAILSKAKRSSASSRSSIAAIAPGASARDSAARRSTTADRLSGAAATAPASGVGQSRAIVSAVSPT